MTAAPSNSLLFPAEQGIARHGRPAAPHFPVLACRTGNRPARAGGSLALFPGDQGISRRGAWAGGDAGSGDGKA